MNIFRLKSHHFCFKRLFQDIIKIDYLKSLLEKLIKKIANTGKTRNRYNPMAGFKTYNRSTFF